MKVFLLVGRVIFFLSLNQIMSKASYDSKGFGFVFGFFFAIYLVFLP